GPSQVRDAAPGSDRRKVRDRRGSELRLFSAIFLSGTISLRAGRPWRSGATQARAQASAPTHRGGPHIHRRGAPEGTVHSIAGSGETDPGTLRHEGSSKKYRAQPTAPSKKTPLNGANDTSATRHGLAAHYGRLRPAPIGRATSAGDGVV